MSKFSDQVLEILDGCEAGNIQAMVRFLDNARIRLSSLEQPNSNNDTIKEGVADDLQFLSDCIKKLNC